MAALQEVSSEKALELVLTLLKGDAAAKALKNGEKLDIPVSFTLLFFLMQL